MTRNGPSRGNSAAVLALLACVLLVLPACGGSEQSPESQIRRLVSDAEEAAEAHDAGAFGDFLSDDYRDSRGYDRQSVLRIVQGVLLRNRQVHLLSVIRDLRVAGDTAGATILVAMAGRPIESTDQLVNVRADLVRFDVEFARNGDEWRVRAVEWRRADASDFL